MNGKANLKIWLAFFACLALSASGCGPRATYVSNSGLKPLAGNAPPRLNDLDTSPTCDPNRLKEEFGLDASSPPSVVAQTLKDAGYSAAHTHLALTKVCGITDAFSVEKILHGAGYSPDEYLESSVIESVRKFAPVLYFDGAHKGLPMSAQVYFSTMMNPVVESTSAIRVALDFSARVLHSKSRADRIPAYLITWTTPWDGPEGKPGVIKVPGRDEKNWGMQNNDFSKLVDAQIPTYYKVISDIDSTVPTGPRGRLRIAYWWFYGFQTYCNPARYGAEAGEHHGDWEHIIVTTDPDRTRADAVTYSFHGDWYTRRWKGFDSVEGHPVVYVGKLAHGNYHDDTHSGWLAGTPSQCCEYADYRNPTRNSKWYNTYQNLVSLRGSEPWMLADRIGSDVSYNGRECRVVPWRWGPHISYRGWWFKWKHIEACGTHPTIEHLDWALKSCDEQGCKGYTAACAYSINPNQGWPW